MFQKINYNIEGSGDQCESSETCVSIHNCSTLIKLVRERGRNSEVAAVIKKKYCGSENGTRKFCCPSLPPDPSSSTSSASPSGFPASNVRQSDYSESGTNKKCALLETCIHIRRCPPLLQWLRKKGKYPAVAAAIQQKQCESKTKMQHVCCPLAALWEPDDPSECGKSEKKFALFVSEGENASLGDWPWMVGLGYRSLSDNKVIHDIKCGAALISRQWIITAAHCVQIPETWELSFARIGDLNLDDAVEDGATPIDSEIDKIIPHPLFSMSPMINDIALIRLKNPVNNYTATVRPICLLSGSQYKSNNYYNGKGPIVIGWGAIGWNELRSNILKAAPLQIIEQGKCDKKFENITGALITDKTLCAKGMAGQDSCQGDSGGPLMFINITENRFYLGGIVSYGKECANEYPGIYTTVAHYIDWINSVTGAAF